MPHRGLVIIVFVISGMRVTAYSTLDRKMGWPEIFKPFHGFLENYIRTKEQGYTHYRVVYSAWFQGMFGAG